MQCLHAHRDIVFVRSFEVIDGCYFMLLVSVGMISNLSYLRPEGGKRHFFQFLHVTELLKTNK